MKDRIVCASIESLKREGLKFSVDTLANSLKISKKTIYKFFPDKETLALAIYQKYYTDAKEKAQMLANSHSPSAHRELLHLYFDVKLMTRRDIFNKYKLNESIYAYTAKQNDDLWEIVSSAFEDMASDQDRDTLRIIVDGSFEKLCNSRLDPDAVIERLVKLL